MRIFRRLTNDPPPACHEISQMNIKNSAENSQSHGSILVSLEYPMNVKLITEEKAIGTLDLIGNIGGYIGLFLGNQGFNYNQVDINIFISCA